MFSSFNPFPSMLSVATGDRKQFQCLQIVCNNKTRSLVLDVFASSKSKPILNFRVMVLRDLKLLALLEVTELGKVLILKFAWSVQIISGLDGQSKFQILTPFSGRRVDGGSILQLGSLNLCNIFRQISEDRENVQTLTGLEKFLNRLSSITS